MADEVTITWPSGKKDEFKGLPAGRLYRIDEAKGFNDLGGEVDLHLLLPREKVARRGRMRVPEPSQAMSSGAKTPIATLCLIRPWGTFSRGEGRR